MTDGPVELTTPDQISESSSVEDKSVTRFTNDQVVTPPPDTDVTVGGGLLLVSTLTNTRSPRPCGDTDSVVPVPVATAPTVEMTLGVAAEGAVVVTGAVVVAVIGAVVVVVV
jgi:hypothetical protein